MRKMLAVLLTFIMMLSLVACGSEKEDDEKDSKPNKNDSEAVSGDEDSKDEGDNEDEQKPDDNKDDKPDEPDEPSTKWKYDGVADLELLDNEQFAAYQGSIIDIAGASSGVCLTEDGKVITLANFSFDEVSEIEVDGAKGFFNPTSINTYHIVETEDGTGVTVMSAYNSNLIVASGYDMTDAIYVEPMQDERVSAIVLRKTDGLVKAYVYAPDGSLILDGVTPVIDCVLVDQDVLGDIVDIYTADYKNYYYIDSENNAYKADSFYGLDLFYDEYKGIVKGYVLDCEYSNCADVCFNVKDDSYKYATGEVIAEVGDVQNLHLYSSEDGEGGYLDHSEKVMTIELPDNVAIEGVMYYVSNCSEGVFVGNNKNVYEIDLNVEEGTNSVTMLPEISELYQAGKIVKIVGMISNMCVLMDDGCVYSLSVD